MRLWAQPWGRGHLIPCRSRPCPQGHVKTCPSALCLHLQALRSCQGFGEEIAAAPCASLSLSRAAPSGCFGGHMRGSLLRCCCSPIPAAHGRGNRSRRRLLLFSGHTRYFGSGSPSFAFAAAAPSPPFCQGQIRRHRGVSGPGAAAAPVPAISMRPASPPGHPREPQLAPRTPRLSPLTPRLSPSTPWLSPSGPGCGVWAVPKLLLARSLSVSERTEAALDAKASLDTGGASQSSEGIQPLCGKVGQRGVRGQVLVPSTPSLAGITRPRAAPSLAQPMEGAARQQEFTGETMPYKHLRAPGPHPSTILAPPHTDLLVPGCKGTPKSNRDVAESRLPLIKSIQSSQPACKE